MKLKAEIITVTDRATLREAITPFDLNLKGGGIFRSRIIKKKVDAMKETYWVECREHGHKQSKNIYQIEYLKNLI